MAADLERRLREAERVGALADLDRRQQKVAAVLAPQRSHPLAAGGGVRLVPERDVALAQFACRPCLTASTRVQFPGGNDLIADSLRSWRERRRISQLELALRAGTTQRHVSFIERGRSAPGRAMVIRLAEALDVPLRERNALLLDAGYAAVYSETAARAARALAAGTGPRARRAPPLPRGAHRRAWAARRRQCGLRRAGRGCRAVTTRAAGQRRAAAAGSGRARLRIVNRRRVGPARDRRGPGARARRRSSSRSSRRAAGRTTTSATPSRCGCVTPT